MFTRCVALAVGAMAVGSLTYAHAQTPTEFAPGYGALDVFNGEGIAATPLWIRIWFAVMIGTFAAGLMFVWRHATAGWAVGGFLLPFLIAGPIFKAFGLPFLGGSIAIAHLVFWTPALILLLLRRPFFDPTEGSSYRIWSAAMTGVIVFSFVFDIRDAAIYTLHFTG